jgi:hypothetical protein
VSSDRVRWRDEDLAKVLTARALVDHFGLHRQGREGWVCAELHVGRDLPYDVARRRLFWSGVATVSATGLATGVAAGSATITATTGTSPSGTATLTVP